MNYILSGTNRPGSRTLQLSKIIQSYYKASDLDSKIIDLSKVDFTTINGSQYSDNQPTKFKDVVESISKARSLTVVVPEYNGSLPGILKYFIDHWKFPESFENRPVSFVGLGGRFGGLRPVEHLQQIFGYRNAYIFPKRVFLSNVWEYLNDDVLTSPDIEKHLKDQVKVFDKFTQALLDAKLHANS